MRITTIRSVSFSLLFIATALVCQAQTRSTGVSPYYSGYQPRHTGFYLKGGIGPSIIEDADLKSFPGVVGSPNVDFEVGVRLDIGGGYQVTDWFAVEFETGFVDNEIDHISGADVDDAFLVNVPFMANVVFQCPRMGRFVPYIGVGAGFSYTILDVDEITIGPNTVFGGSEDDAVFAYQGFVGFRYFIDSRWSIGAAYKYVVTDDSSFDVGGTSERVKLDDLHTHSVTASFTFHF
jgi:opacity protein-like surface antigen